LHGGILILGAAALPIGRVARRIVALLGVGRVIGGLWISLSFRSRCFLIRLGLSLARERWLSAALPFCASDPFVLFSPWLSVPLEGVWLPGEFCP